MSDEIHRSLGRIEGQLQALLEMSKAKDARVDSLDARLRTTEAEVTTMKTTSGIIASGAAFVVSAVSAIVPSIFHK